MDAIVVASLSLVAITGTGVVLTRDPRRQAVVLSVLGLALSVAFVALGAPDVALSQLAVGAVVTPLMVLFAHRKTTRRGDE